MCCGLPSAVQCCDWLIQWLVDFSLIMSLSMVSVVIGWSVISVGYCCSWILLVISNTWMVGWLQLDTAGEIQHLVGWLVAV